MASNVLRVFEAKMRKTFFLRIRYKTRRGISNYEPVTVINFFNANSYLSATVFNVRLEIGEIRNFDMLSCSFGGKDSENCTLRNLSAILLERLICSTVFICSMETLSVVLFSFAKSSLDRNHASHFNFASVVTRWAEIVLKAMNRSLV